LPVINIAEGPEICHTNFTSTLLLNIDILIIRIFYQYWKWFFFSWQWYVPVLSKIDVRNFSLSILCHVVYHCTVFVRGESTCKSVFDWVYNSKLFHEFLWMIKIVLACIKQFGWPCSYW
jgi:hypothetical protein